MKIAAMAKRSADAVQGGKLVSDSFAAAKFDPQKNVEAIVNSTAMRGDVVMSINLKTVARGGRLGAWMKFAKCPAYSA